MSLRVGSIGWLLAHELRLKWRRTVRDRPGRLLIFALVMVGVFTLLGVLIGLGLRDFRVPMTPAAILTADGALAALFTLMLSQSLSQATEALYTRGDLDLLLSSPIAPHTVVAVRVAAISANAFTTFAILLSPFLIPVALIGHPAWLAGFPVLAALALDSGALGLMLAMGLFRLIGPRRTRAAAQILGAFIGAAVFLSSQARNIIGPQKLDLWLGALGRILHSDLKPPPAAAWPLRAMLGEPGPLAGFVGLSIALFVATLWWLSARFADNAAAASGADSPGARTGASARFVSGAFAATLRKELRLLGRDIVLLSEVMLRLLYLAPLTFLLLRNAGHHGRGDLPMSVGLLSFVIGQITENLTWITLSAEDAPDLLAASPAATAVLHRAKLCAAFLPLAMLLMLPIGWLTLLSPWVGVAAALGCAASALASGLINLWHQKLERRSAFRRRSAAAWGLNLTQLAVGGLIAVGAGLGAAGSLFALAPLTLVLIALAFLRRGEAQIAMRLGRG